MVAAYNQVLYIQMNFVQNTYSDLSANDFCQVPFSFAYIVMLTAMLVWKLLLLLYIETRGSDVLIIGYVDIL